MPKTRSTRKINIKYLDSDSSDDSDTADCDVQQPNNVTMVTSKKRPKPMKDSSSSSESDIETYLRRPDELDLNSSFFKVEKPKHSFAQIEDQIFSGVNRLSDSGSESDEDKTTNEVAEKTPDNVQTRVNFQQLNEYTKKIEQAKLHVEKYISNKKAKEEKSADISKLLKIGEKTIEDSSELSPDIKAALADGTLHSSDFESCSGSEKEDWEEVAERSEITNSEKIRKEGVEITLELPTILKKKKGVDLLAAMKRRLNRIKKENQVFIHKVHLLCWLGHGNYVNQILNDQTLLGLALSLLPSQHCYPSERINLKYLEQIVSWYRKAIIIMDKTDPLTRPLDEYLISQINKKQAANRKTFVYIFICILRSLGVQTRLVLSFQVEPLKPPASELCSLSTTKPSKDENKKPDEAIVQYPSKSTKTNKTILNRSANKLKTESKASTKTHKNDECPGTSKDQNKKVAAKRMKAMSNEKTVTNNEKIPKLAGPNPPTSTIVEKKTPKKDENAKSKKRTRIENACSKEVDDSVDTNINALVSTLENLEKGITKTTRKSTRKASTSCEKNQTQNESKKLSLRRTAKVDGDKSNMDKQKTKKSNFPQKLEPKDDEVFTEVPKKGVIRMPIKRKLKSVSAPQVDGAFDLSDNENESDNIPSQLDGTDDENLPSTSKKLKFQNLSESSIDCFKIHTSRRKTKPNNGDSDFEESRSPFSSKNLKANKASPNKSKKSIPSKFKNDLQKSSLTSKSSKPLDIRGDIINLVKGRINEQKNKDQRRRANTSSTIDYDNSDSDYAPEPIRKKKVDSDNNSIEKTKVKRRIPPKKELDRRVLSSDEEKKAGKSNKNVNIWIEIFLEDEEKWISADVINGKIHCVKELYSKASHPISYILGWDNSNRVKDVTARYCPNWNTVTRKLRVDKTWWDKSLKPFKGVKNIRDKEEDEDLARQQLDQPLPKTISEYKDHPLYVLKRHLLKFQAIYPPDAITLGYVRNEPVYSRDCVYTLHSREIWVKHAKVVKPGETPYKIVKARPKYDKLSNSVITDQLLEIFGIWQVDDYVPPTAENGVVPRNAYGNVELFKKCMLPKKTVHLILPGLNKVARKLNIDCAPAVVGFDFHSGWSHPTFDGFVVCEEFEDVLVAAWNEEQEISEKREQEKYEKRVYGNWRRLIKAVLIRERLKARYDFGQTKKEKPAKQKGPRFLVKKKKY